MIDTLSENQWREYKSQGYSRLGKVLTDEELATLQQRIDEIMMGRVPLDYDRMLMQLDQPGTGKLGPQTKGHKGATLCYRKIQDLELDPHFLAYMQKTLFHHICARVYGKDTDIACFRAMFMNKPAKEGTHLQWHQDRWSYLDRDPLVTIWTALDQSTIENGCLQIASGAHDQTLNPIKPDRHLSGEQLQDFLENFEVTPLELEAGECVLLHNHLPHSSGINTTETPRRAFSACYMEAATRTTKDETYTVLFSDGAIRIENS